MLKAEIYQSFWIGWQHQFCSFYPSVPVFHNTFSLRSLLLVTQHEINDQCTFFWNVPHENSHHSRSTEGTCSLIHLCFNSSDHHILSSTLSWLMTCSKYFHKALFSLDIVPVNSTQHTYVDPIKLASFF